MGSEYEYTRIASMVDNSPQPLESDTIADSDIHIAEQK